MKRTSLPVPTDRVLFTRPRPGIGPVSSLPVPREGRLGWRGFNYDTITGIPN